jgi:ammonium transporter, Amt family
MGTAGLVANTPTLSFVVPGGALVIGVAAGLKCFWGATSLNNALGYGRAPVASATAGDRVI